MDTARITEILLELDRANLSSGGDIVAMAAEELLGTPYVAGTLEGEPEMLTVNIEQMDCTTFVETCLALAMTIENRRSSWRDFVYNLEQVRYRGGKIDGYPSRLHYISDWIVDNSHRGNIEDVTSRVGRASHEVKTLDFMSTNRDKYKALKDNDKNFEGIKSFEMGFRSHRFPYIKTMNIKDANIKEGDVIFITTSIKGLDVTHAGIATIKDGVVHLLHASSKAGKVVMDPLPLQEYVRRNRRATGIRVVRIKD
ncbi:MAG: DUF1460 domain-containing protein [Bacteroides sp.]|nr:DUF1460 domain-containing protein [Bacteroides sp.]